MIRETPPAQSTLLTTSPKTWGIEASLVIEPWLLVIRRYVNIARRTFERHTPFRFLPSPHLVRRQHPHVPRCGLHIGEPAVFAHTRFRTLQEILQRTILAPIDVCLFKLQGRLLVVALAQAHHPLPESIAGFD